MSSLEDSSIHKIVVSVLEKLIEMDPLDTSRSVTVDCDDGNGFESSKIGLRISSIFVIWFGSTAGALIPIFLSKSKRTNVSSWIFASMKYFGSGVILATAFIHLLGPATEALSSPCLTGRITEYSWAEGIVLMSIFVMFFIELLAHQYDVFGNDFHDSEVISSSINYDSKWAERSKELPKLSDSNGAPNSNDAGSASNSLDREDLTTRNSVSNVQNGSRATVNSQNPINNDPMESRNNYFSAQLTAIFILEFGVIFHSIFIGLTLAVTGSDEFNILYTVLVFHQTFEGLGLGSRLASVTWPKGKSWLSWVFGAAYGLTTPIAIAIGIGVHESFKPGSQRATIVNGIFDSISAGILIYTGLVELMANEFIYNKEMYKASPKTIIFACLNMSFGAAVMALLGKWA
ncbi:putative plasma membrane low affinity zinc ion protein [Erysiphe necator]|uniref:Putative plasma membrane low affinity zinc ion protein n=1 Tax=Uncinula necator TaxID=52586 RepID=A0A0B1NXL1_UNCNE|nr:putative plasma membrane low affinity zinc ion protein [Erysiphe necator]